MQCSGFKAQYKRLRTEIDRAILEVLAHHRYVMGPEVVQLEARLAAYAGVKHCVAVSSGADALLQAMLALDIRAGDEVITPAFSFIAVAEMAVLLGVKPVFIDVDPETYTLDPTALAGLVTEKTRAIIPIGLYGQCADLESIHTFAAAQGIPVIDDAAQSFGSVHRGVPAGKWAKISCTSFYPTKPLGCYGDGGACFTDDDVLAERLRQCRHHGQSGTYQHDRIGMTGRLDSIQAAVLLVKLAIFDDEIAKRQAVAAQYDALLGDLVKTPQVPAYNTSVYAQYTVQLLHRDRCREALQQAGIPTAIHYPKPIYCQAAYRQTDTAAPVLPVTEYLTQHVLSLPMHPYLQAAEITQVAQVLLAAVEAST